MYRLLIDRPVAGALLALGVLVFGGTAYLGLPVAALPDIQYPTIMVEASLPGASPETIADTVAEPLEGQLGRVRGVTSMTSVSTGGSTTIQLQLSLDRDLGDAAMEVQSALAAAAGDLPENMPKPPRWYFDNPSDYSVLALGFTSKSMPLEKVDAFADRIVARRANQIPGVRGVVNWARQYPAVRVEANPTALAAQGLSLEALRKAIANGSIDTPKGALDGGSLIRNVMANDQLYDAEAFKRLVVAYKNGTPVRLAQVATVTDGPEYPDEAGSHDGQRAVAFGFRRSLGASVVAAVDAIRARLPSLMSELPIGIETHVLIDRSLSIRQGVHEIAATLALTIALVVFVMLIFLRSIRAAIVPIVVIPLSLCATFSVMFVLQYSVDNLSVMALTISVGFLVDDAIVVIENIARRLELGEAPRTAALAGVGQVGFTIVAITASLAAVFIPVLFMQGVAGRLLREFGVTASAAVIASGMVSLFLTPMMCARLLTRSTERKATQLVDKLSHGYQNSLCWALRNQGVVMACFGLSVVSVIWLYLAIPRGFLPPQDTGRLTGSLIVRPDLAPAARRQIEERVSAILRNDPDVAHVTFWPGDDFLVSLTPAENRHESLDVGLNRLRLATTRLYGAEFYLKPQDDVVIGGGLNGGHAQYEYELADASSEELAKWLPVLERALQQVPELRDVAADDAQMASSVRFEVDRDRASSLGVTMGEVDQTLDDAFGRRQVREIFNGSSQYYVTLRTPPEFRTDERALDYLYVDSASGAVVPMSAFVTTNIVRSPMVIKHEGQLPAAAISFNLCPGVSLGTAVDRIRAIERQLRKPITLETSFAGVAGEFERSLASGPWLIAAAVLVVYIVLGILYESALHPLIILSTLPSAGLGALLILWVADYDLNLISSIGILLLVGIVKKNAIMIVDFAIQAEREGKLPVTAVLDACTTRFRPIMMTTVTALVGAVPLALGHGPGFELRRPLGLAIVGGLGVSQLLTLYSTPVIYLAMVRLRQGKINRAGAPVAHRPSFGDRISSRTSW